MLSFDENTLLIELSKLPNHYSAAFATAAASRQLTNYERFADEISIPNTQRPREITTQLWVALQTGSVHRLSWTSTLDELMSLLPDESDDWSVYLALADNALTSLSYAVRTLLTQNPQEAVWAAQQAYEAADQAVRDLEAKSGLPLTEAHIKAHPWVQRELERQHRDLTVLLADQSHVCISELQKWAFYEELLTVEEASSLK